MQNVTEFNDAEFRGSTPGLWLFKAYPWLSKVKKGRGKVQMNKDKM